ALPRNGGGSARQYHGSAVWLAQRRAGDVAIAAIGIDRGDGPLGRWAMAATARRPEPQDVARPELHIRCAGGWDRLPVDPNRASTSRPTAGDALGGISHAAG